MNEFSFYFNYQRITNCEPEYLAELYDGIEGADEIIQGILDSKARWDEKNSPQATEEDIEYVI